jgi:hypothetical protein
VAFLWLLVGCFLGFMAAVLLVEAICDPAAVPSRGPPSPGTVSPVSRAGLSPRGTEDGSGGPVHPGPSCIGAGPCRRRSL